MNLNFFKKSKTKAHENTCLKVCMYCRNVNYINEDSQCTKCGRKTIDMMAVECYECKKTWLQKPKKDEANPNIILFDIKCPACGTKQPQRIFTEPLINNPLKWEDFYERIPFLDRLL